MNLVNRNRKKKKKDHRGTDKSENREEAWKIGFEDSGPARWLAIAKLEVMHRDN